MKYLLLLLCLISPFATAVVETYEFGNEVNRERYHQFIDELRCPKCQNQNLDGSNAPIAKDLRRELHRLLEDGQSDAQIVEFMVERYGEFVLYRPRFNAETAVLWLAPGIFLLIGIVVMVMVFKRQKSAPSVSNTDSASLDTDEQQRLQDLLAAADNNKDKPNA
ncbi:cytochrome c-type biogenesis protein [Oceanicoccus sagamiensis]|uniref:Cytochrome c-type biogenesis protein n=1 Tax=Oceanicoccus sagamiensis TaxID=716816 RepID=A0A1X9ND05_9GAMM|nr:cytochrome c-type biogenesis protein [Oceanicoccus sagamiensis]ARN75446.1 cytochrome c-type biogenesis protein CcmH [Oceanicoccus sagamiensis]